MIQDPAHSGTEPAPSSRVAQFVLVASAVVLLGLVIVCIQALFRDTRHPPRAGCASNLRELGTHLVIYCHRFGLYPQRTGADFLNTLRRDGRYPLLEDADALFVCPLTGSEPGPETCGYRGPKDPIVESRLRSDTPLACDRPENHGTNEPINVLYPNGRIEQIYPENPRYQEVLSKTSD